jgi:hypothetical protein
MPLWPRVWAPDLGIPVGSSRFADRSILEPPARYLRWSDRIETVLADDRDSVQEVTRRCQAVGVKPHFPGGMLYGCTHWAAGRCLITRIDDPGVARHELGHCNGWPSGHPR